ELRRARGRQTRNRTKNPFRRQFDQGDRFPGDCSGMDCYHFTGVAMRKRQILWKSSLMLSIVGALLLAVTNQSFAQDVNASLSGTVTDPSGAAVPNAKLTLTNEATGFQFSFVSDEAGNYSFRNLTPGKYSLSVSAGGFKTQDQKGIELAINQPGHVDVHLPVGQ